MEIILNDPEQKLVKYIASLRIKYDRESGAIATIYDEKDALEAETDYYGAEVAYCKMMNIFPDTGYKTRQPFDCISRDGNKVDVKQTYRQNGRLLVKSKLRDYLPDIYALMIGKFPAYRYAGMIKASELLVDERLDTTLPHPAYAAGQNELSINGI